MRALSLLASAVLMLVLAVAVVDASVFAGKTKAPKSAAKHARTPGGGAFIKPSELLRNGPSHHASGNNNQNSWGPTYKLAYDLLVAFQIRNFTAASSLIADDAMAVISAVGCGTMTKQQLIGAAMNDHAVARYWQFGTWAGYEGNGMGALGTIGAVGGPDSVFPNATKMINDVVFYFVPTTDGTQLAIIEQLTDRSWAQPNNATQIRNVWNSMADAANLHDTAAFSALLREDAQFFMHYAWEQYPTQSADNRTAIMDIISPAWAAQSKNGVVTNFVSVMCDIVIAQFTWSTTTNENGGGAQIMNFLMSVVVDENFKITQFNEFALMPFMN